MIKEYWLDTPHILQDDCASRTPERCGAACVQMVLHSVDPGRPFGKHEQDALFSDIKGNDPASSTWHSPPQGMKEVLNKQGPAARKPMRTLPPDISKLVGSPPILAARYEFRILGGSSGVPHDPGILRAITYANQRRQIELLSGVLIQTIAVNGAAPIVAVHEDNAHWVVVNGFQMQDDAADISETGKIKAMLIQDPMGRYTYRATSCHLLEETEGDNLTGKSCLETACPNQVVSYDTWVSEYMLDDWAESFVVICDKPTKLASKAMAKIRSLSPPPATPEFVPAREFSRAVDHAEKRGPQRKTRITEEEAMDRAKSAIGEFNLSALNQRVFARAVSAPVVVTRLDRIDSDYYLVPVGEENQISALINISTEGKFNEAAVWPPGYHIVPFTSHPEFDLLTGPDSPLAGRRIRLSPKQPLLTIISVTRHPTVPYVWRPCRQSFSSFKPFHNLVLTLEGGEKKTFSLPIDDHCLEREKKGIFRQPPPEYLEQLRACIKAAATNIGEVKVDVNRYGDTARVRYESKGAQGIESELNHMERIICRCLRRYPREGLTHFRIKCFETDGFMRKDHGGGEDTPLGTRPASGGGPGQGTPISSCS